MKTNIFPSCILVLLLFGCQGPFYFDIVGDNIITRYDATEIIPQKGTALTIDLSYEIVPATRFTYQEEYRYYRYRVLIDGWEYCYGVNQYADDKISIPIMANDTHSPVSIKVEGSKSKDYNLFPSEWEDWHELYSGIQEPLAESEEPAFSILKDLQLGVEIEGETYHFEFLDCGAAEAFKRIMMVRNVTLPCTIKGCIDSKSVWSVEYFYNKIKSAVPENYDSFNGSYTIGGLYLQNYSGFIKICMQEYKDMSKYRTLIATVREEELDDLKSLKQRLSGEGKMTLFLTDSR